MFKPINVISFYLKLPDDQADQIIQRATNDPEFSTYHSDNDSLQRDDPNLTDIIWRNDFRGLRWNITRSNSGCAIIGWLVTSIALNYHCITPTEAKILNEIIVRDANQLGIPSDDIRVCSWTSEAILDIEEIERCVDHPVQYIHDIIRDDDDTHIEFGNYVPIPQEISPEFASFVWMNPIPKQDNPDNSQYLYHTSIGFDQSDEDIPDDRNIRTTGRVLVVQAVCVARGDDRVPILELNADPYIGEATINFRDLDKLLQDMFSKNLTPSIFQHLWENTRLHESTT